MKPFMGRPGCSEVHAFGATSPGKSRRKPKQLETVDGSGLALSLDTKGNFGLAGEAPGGEFDSPTSSAVSLAAGNQIAGGFSFGLAPIAVGRFVRSRLRPCYRMRSPRARQSVAWRGEP